MCFHYNDYGKKLKKRLLKNPQTVTVLGDVISGRFMNADVIVSLNVMERCLIL